MFWVLEPEPVAPAAHRALAERFGMMQAQGLQRVGRHDRDLEVIGTNDGEQRHGKCPAKWELVLTYSPGKSWARIVYEPCSV